MSQPALDRGIPGMHATHVKVGIDFTLRHRPRLDQTGVRSEVFDAKRLAGGEQGDGPDLRLLELQRPQEEEVHAIVGQAVGAARDPLPGAVDIPHRTGARRRLEEIVAVAEMGQTILLLPLGQRLEPEPEIEREIAPQPDIVLREQRGVPDPEVPLRIADRQGIRRRRAGKEVVDAAPAVSNAETDQSADIVALHAVVVGAVQIVSGFVRVPPARMSNGTGALHVVQLAEDRILHRLRTERAISGHGDGREILESFFHRQVDTAIGVAEAELADGRGREDACQYRAAGMRPVDDVAAVAAEDAGDLVVLIAEVVAAHHPRGVAPVIVEAGERIRRVVAERDVRLVAAGVDRRPVRQRV